MNSFVCSIRYTQKNEWKLVISIEAVKRIGASANKQTFRPKMQWKYFRATAAF